nr:AAA family ATPase [Rhodococcus sp. (in: high G+C Gram-positive bacteria)]
MHDENTPTGLAVVNGTWLDAQTFPEMKWVVPGVIPEGLSILAGAPKLGKSWLTFGIALAVAAGGRALGSIPVGDPRPVLLLALEDGHRRLQTRARHLLEGAPIPAMLEMAIKGTPLEIEAHIIEWLERHTDAAPLIIIDTLGKVMPNESTGESAYARDYRVIGKYKRLVDEHPGAGLVFVHHTKKGAMGDFLESVSGTQGIAGAADSTLILTRPRQSSGGILAVTGRDVPENEYAMTSDSGRWNLDGKDLVEAAQVAVSRQNTEGVGDKSAEIIDLVEKNPHGITPAQVDIALGIKDSRTYLGRLYDAGRIARPSRGKYAPVASVASVANGGQAPSSGVTRF